MELLDFKNGDKLLVIFTVCQYEKSTTLLLTDVATSKAGCESKSLRKSLIRGSNETVIKLQ